MKSIFVNKPDRPKSVTLIFKREELLYDITNYAYVEGDMMKTDSPHDRHQVQAVDEDGNKDCITRALDLAFAECVEACYPYSKEDVTEEVVMDDELKDEGDYILRLQVPDSFSQTTVDLLLRLIHKLLVYHAIKEWMSLTKPESMSLWQAKIDKIQEKVSSALAARTRPVRRPLRPF